MWRDLSGNMSFLVALIDYSCPGTVRCVLCQAVLSFRQNDKSKQQEHRVNTETDIFLADCLMDEEELEVVKNVSFLLREF